MGPNDYDKIEDWIQGSIRPMADKLHRDVLLPISGVWLSRVRKFCRDGFLVETPSEFGRLGWLASRVAAGFPLVRNPRFNPELHGPN